MKRFLLLLLLASTALGQTSVTVDKNGNVLNAKPTNFPTSQLLVNGIPINAGQGGIGTVQSVDITPPAAGITVSGGPITTTGSITLTLANDLAALEGLTGTGFAKRTGADTWVLASVPDDTAVVHNTGNETVAGVKTFSSAPIFSSATASTLAYLDASKNVVSLGTPTARGLNKEVWIAVRNPTGCGSDGMTGCAGTAEDPFDGSTKTKFNAIMAALVPNETVHFGPGIFLTDEITIQSGDVFVATGSAVTTFQLADQGSGVFSGEISIINNRSNHALDGVLVKGITFDCNLSGQSSSTAVTGAILIAGTRCRIENCRAKNFGTKLASTEDFVFGIFSFQGGGLSGPAYGNKILNSDVDSPAAVSFLNGVTAFIIAGTGLTGSNVYIPGGDGWIHGAEIAGCSAHDITVGTGSGQPNYFHETTLTWTVGGMVHNNHGSNFLSSHSDGSFTDCTGFFQDTGSNFGTQVFHNSWWNVEHGVYINLGSSTHYLFNDGHFAGNYIQTIGASNKGMEINSDPSNKSTNLSIDNKNVILAPSGQVGILLTNITGSFIENNTIDTSSSHVIQDNGGNTNVFQHGNHKIDGTIITSDFAPTISDLTQMSIDNTSAAGLKLTNDVSAPGNNQVYSTDGAGARGWHTVSAGFDSILVVASDATTTGQTLVDVPDLITPTLSKNTLYQFEADLYVGTSAVTTGTQYGVNVSVAPTFIVANYTGPTTVAAGVQAGITLGTNLNNTATGSGSPFLTTASETGFLQITGAFKTGGSGSPAFSIQHLKTTSGTSTVFAGSLLKIRSVRSFTAPLL